MGIIEWLLVLFVIIVVFAIVVARSKNGKNIKKEKIEFFKDKLSKTDSESKSYKIAEDGTIIRKGKH